LPDEALVVRGGRNRPEDIARGTATHPSGVTGISVESATNVTLEALAAFIPHRQVGVTTVGEVRKLGGCHPDIREKPLPCDLDGHYAHTGKPLVEPHAAESGLGRSVLKSDHERAPHLCGLS
jgi:hypothetical protein